MYDYFTKEESTKIVPTLNQIVYKKKIAFKDVSSRSITKQIIVFD